MGGIHLRIEKVGSTVVSGSDMDHGDEDSRIKSLE